MNLKAGDQAPDFSLPTTHGLFKLSEKRGHPILLYFYPKDDTSGCTQQACELTSALPNFPSSLEVLGVSRDSLESHKKFQEKYQITFPLASDLEGTVCALYDVWKEKSLYGKKYFGIERSTFLIDSEGVLLEVWYKVKVAGHVEAINKVLAHL